MEDTKQDLESTIQIAKSLEIDIPTFSLLTPFPGTKLMEQALKENLLLTKDWKDFNWSVPVLKYPNLTSEDLNYYMDKAYHDCMSFKNAMAGIKRFIKMRGLMYHLKRINPADIVSVAAKNLKKMVSKY